MAEQPANLAGSSPATQVILPHTSHLTLKYPKGSGQKLLIAADHSPLRLHKKAEKVLH